MLTEEEKYYRFDQLLKGKLSKEEEMELKASFSSEAFTSESETHRIANEAIGENYLAGIRSATKKVIKRNALIKRINYSAGIGMMLMGVLALYVYAPVKETVETKPSKTQNTPKLPDPKSKYVVKTAKPTKEFARPIKPNEKDQTTNIISSVSTIETPIQPVNNENIKSPTITENKIPGSEFAEKSEPTLGKTDPKTDEKPQTEKRRTQQDILELILNPDRNEWVTFPVEDDFQGEISVFNASGNLVFRQFINQGKPNQWDGTMQTGGLAPSGQYGFVIKTNYGVELKQGFVTVVR